MDKQPSYKKVQPRFILERNIKGSAYLPTYSNDTPITNDIIKHVCVCVSIALHNIIELNKNLKFKRVGINLCYKKVRKQGTTVTIRDNFINLW